MTTVHARRPVSFIAHLKTVWHKRASQLLAAVTVAHWAEHLAQVVQIWVLDRPRPAARGVLGGPFPWLVSSEWLHYGYALVMLVGLAVLLQAFTGTARRWWIVALVVQLWHHAEHALLLYQAQTHHHLFGEPAPTSLVQLIFPRAELHLVYNLIVTVPMLAALCLHLRPPFGERASMTCACARPATAA